MEELRSLLEDVTLAAHRAYANGLQRGSGGNISALLPSGGGMVVKSTGGSFADCDAQGAGWVKTGFDGTPLPGESGTPTREWRLHAALLQHVAGARAVVHCHAPHCIAWAEGHSELPQTTWHTRLKFPGPLPVLDIRAAVVPQEEMPRVLALFGATPGLPAFLLRGHGLVAVGETAVIAQHTAELAEETAQVCVLQALLKGGGSHAV